MVLKVLIISDTLSLIVKFSQYASNKISIPFLGKQEETCRNLNVLACKVINSECPVLSKCSILGEF